MFNFYAPVNKTSYGIVSTNIASELIKKKLDFKLYPLASTELNIYGNIDNLKPAILRSKEIRVDWPTVKLWHHRDVNQFIRGSKYILFTVFEQNSFTKESIEQLSTLDKILVPSAWAKSVLIDSGITCEVDVIPLGIDNSIFYPIEQKGFDTYTFLNVGKLESRKGHQELVEIFNDTFDISDNVALYLMIDNQYIPDLVTSFKHNTKKTKLGSKINFIDGNINTKTLRNIYQNINCYVSPSKAEGWNLPLLEAISCGRPAIVNNYSAHTEFCTKNNSHLIDPVGFDKAYDGIFFDGSSEWSRINKEEFGRVMRYHYDNKVLNNGGSQYTADTYTWEHSSKNLLQKI